MFLLQRFVSRRRHLTLISKYSTKSKRAEHAEKVARYGGEFPEKLLNKKLKTPAHMYLANSQIAEQIDKYLEPHLNTTKCDTVLEINPGACHFTRKLLDREHQFRKMILVETLDHFMPHLQELHSLYPERVKVRQGDFVRLWKLAYQDKMDNGTRVADLLVDVPRRMYEDEPNILLFGAVGSYNFFKHLINSLVFQNSLLMMGRCEMFFAVPPPIYIHLTCSNDIGYMIYRSTSVLFQILFEHSFIGQVPREHFLPTQAEYNIGKNSKLGKVNSINPENLYLVKIVPRRDIFKLLAVSDLPALWYFIKQNFVSRRNRIIPNLEKWVPGCGPRLIINAKSPAKLQPVYPNEDCKKLPQFSKRCMTMSSEDYFPNLNIYTQFGDLSASQMLTLFTQFRQWPEYSQSSFLASLESSLLKMEATTDESIDGISIAEEDDISADIAVDLDESKNVEVQKTSKRRKSKNI